MEFFFVICVDRDDTTLAIASNHMKTTLNSYNISVAKCAISRFLNVTGFALSTASKRKWYIASKSAVENEKDYGGSRVYGCSLSLVEQRSSLSKAS